MTDFQTTLIIVGVAVARVLSCSFSFKCSWRIAEPDEALIISGLAHGKSPASVAGESMRFKIVTGGGTSSCPACRRSAPSR